MKNLRSDQKLLLLATLSSILLWILPYGRLLTVPILYLNTHLHELCHALATVATGGQPEKIEVFTNGSGVTPVMGGVMFIVASAGYVGSAIIGALMVYFSRSEKGARAALFVIASALTISMLLWVRGDAVGVISGICWIGLLSLMATRLKGDWLKFAAQFLGFQQLVMAFQSLFTLWEISAFTESMSDASNMQNSTQIPAVFWASTWCLFSGLLAFLTLRSAWRSGPSSRYAQQ